MTEMISNNLILNKYIEDDPVACARYLEVTPQETVVDFLESLPIDSGLKVMHHLNDAYLTLILSNFKDEVFSQVVERLDVNRSASILLQLTLEKRELLLKKLDNKKRKEIQELIEYPNNSAGRLMTKELMALHL
ncbi:MAG: magnesium transporter, partial [Candidatus Omnitrophota bacterium]